LPNKKDLFQYFSLFQIVFSAQSFTHQHIHVYAFTMALPLAEFYDLANRKSTLIK